MTALREATFSAAVATAFSKYANFSDRASRSEYWFFTLFNCFAWIGVALIGGLISAVTTDLIGGALVVFYWLAIVLPGLAVTVRRLHDTNRSGWWFLIAAVPLVGGIALLVFLCSPPVFAGNRYD